MKVSKIYPKDILAFFALIACFILIGLGVDHVVSGIAIMIITYYFSKRVYEEKNPNGDLKEKVNKILEDVKQNKEETTELKSYIPKPMLPGEVIVKKPISNY